MRYSCARLGLLVSLLIASSASAVTVAWTAIANSGNAADTQVMVDGTSGYGAVSYAYWIGSYEVTNAQYVEFLNAKAQSDPLELYHWEMAPSEPAPYSGSIIQSGSLGNYTYSVAPGRENVPVNDVTFFNVLRFVNWKNNGQGDADTETGSYTLLGGTPTPSNATTVTRNPGAGIVLAIENEWYKAAYYDPSTASYFDYPTASNTLPACTAPTAAPNSANCDPGPGFAVPSLVPGGSYPGSPSPYGTFDQGGNVFEWNESAITDLSRGMRGGSNIDSAIALHAAGRNSASADSTVFFLGFRLAYVPEPSTGVLVMDGLLGLTGWRRG